MSKKEKMLIVKAVKNNKEYVFELKESFEEYGKDMINFWTKNDWKLQEMLSNTFINLIK